MTKRVNFYVIIIFLLLVFGVLIWEIEKYNQENKNSLNQTTEFPAYRQAGYKPKQLILDVSYINEAPDGNFIGPWKNACEEASITMVEKYYSGVKSVSIAEAKQYMQNLFDIQDRLYGTNASINASHIAEVINNYTSFRAVVKDNPTIEDIKRQIIRNRPVISLHYGFDLKNQNIPFAINGSYYHVMVVVGYDDEKKEFITNDDGDMKNGKSHRYNYDLFINSLHDYNPSLNKTNGPSRVIFTRKK